MRFATKLTLAQRMLERAFAAAVPAGWVVADSFSGRSHAFRHWLEERGPPSPLMVPKTHAVWYAGRRQTATKLGTQLPSTAWVLRSVGTGTQGERCGLWAGLSLSETCTPGMRHWLLVPQALEDPTDLAYHVACGPAATSVEELLRVCGRRWQIEEGVAQAKGEVGLDQYEVRTWVAWHRFSTLCLLAPAYLVVLRLQVGQIEPAAEKGELLLA